ncbi:helix-turn-helix transcriptional regulator [Bradyrhizobium diazoefficiens]|nr:TetR/AcrR family transcriptional regulator [Bradyrhizobium diazoefficiens]MBR0777926.1 helix-turn-helix transcriptional regulator [Bradyrhizobium diazoefficiens]
MRAKFADGDFLTAALAIAVEHGPAAATVASISDRLKAPIGSFYHRFSSRDVLLGSLWLKTVLDFQKGVSVALDAQNGLEAALHTPKWSRQHLDEARLLLVFDREDFVRDEWPEELREQVAAMSRRMKNAASRRAHAVFGRDGAEERRLADFLISNVPVAAVREHIKRREAPPPIVDQMICTTYSAIVADYRARHANDD